MFTEKTNASERFLWFEHGGCEGCWELITSCEYDESIFLRGMCVSGTAAKTIFDLAQKFVKEQVLSRYEQSGLLLTTH